MLYPGTSIYFINGNKKVPGNCFYYTVGIPVLQVIYMQFIYRHSVFQRPSAKELMRHPFIKKAKKNAYLMDLIDRYRKWKLTRGDESESDSGGESGNEVGGEESDTDWNMTVKGPPVSYIEPLRSAATAGGAPSLGSDSDSMGYSAPVNSDKERGTSAPCCCVILVPVQSRGLLFV